MLRPVLSQPGAATNTPGVSLRVLRAILADVQAQSTTSTPDLTMYVIVGLLQMAVAAKRPSVTATAKRPSVTATGRHH